MAVAEREAEIAITNPNMIQIRVRVGSEYARLMWEEDSGLVVLVSSYEDGSHYWSHRGEGVSVAEFLSTLDRDYCGKKLLGTRLYEYSPERTTELIEEHINDLLLDEEQASERTILRQLKDSDISFDEWMSLTKFDDAYEFHSTDVIPSWATFWERIWVPHIQPTLAKL